MIGVSVVPIGQARGQHEREVQPLLPDVEVLEALGEGQREQEPRQQLHARLHHPQLLEHVVPVAVQLLGLGLVAVVLLVGHAPWLPHADVADHTLID